MRESEEKALNDLIKATVFNILTKDQATRNSDKKLYIEVCRHMCPNLLGQSLENAFLYGDLPNYESVRRYRQKFQEKYEELRPCEKVQEYREDQERQYMMEFGR